MRINKIVSFSVVLLVITVVFAGAVPAAAQTDTMQFRYNLNRTGDYSPIAGDRPANNKLAEFWVVPSHNCEGLSPPVYANGVIYVGASGDQSGIYTMNTPQQKANATLLYSTGTDAVAISPAVANGVVYFVTVSGVVHAVYTNNGTQLWTFSMPGTLFTSSPAVKNGIVYIVGGDDFGNVYALFANNGTQLWASQPGAHVTSSPTVPAVLRGDVYVAGASNVYALDPSTGATLWSRSVAPTSAWISTPAYSNGVLYVQSDDNNVTALNAANGATLWSNSTGGEGVCDPAVANGVVYVGGVSEYNETTNLWNNGTVYALNATSGARIWSFQTGGWVNDPAVANGAVYVGNYADTYALNATTGAKLWTELTIVSPSDPIVVNETVILTQQPVVVTALGTPYPSLNATATPGSALVNQNFTISGQLWSPGDPIVGPAGGIFNRTVQLYRLDGANWVYTGMHTKTTGTAQSPSSSDGYYSFSVNASTPGSHLYRVYFPGDGGGDKFVGGTGFVNATSNVVTVTVKYGTTLTATAPANALLNTSFTVNGTLKTTGGKPVAGATIQLQRYTSVGVLHLWLNVTGKAKTMASTGAYRISTSESAAGTYYYRTIYAGNATYWGCTSNTLTVKNLG